MYFITSKDDTDSLELAKKVCIKLYEVQKKALKEKYTEKSESK